MPKTPEEKREAARKKTAAWRAANPEKAKASDAAQYAKNRAKVIARVTAAHQANPEKVKTDWAAYYLKKHDELLAKRVAYGVKNPEKIKASNAAQYAANPERSYANGVKFRQENPETIKGYKAAERARKKNAPVCDFTPAQWREMKEHYGYRCVYCYRKMKHLTQDHITPLSKGGSHTISNIVPACKSCNSRKNVGPPLIPVQPLLF